ncbi:ABC transporter permease [Carnobacterium divergens]|uniref:ABC transporter permease n=1 Tax=Carnobacterium divergens TaxID=2748 RepID=UPI0007F452C3|nr:ABC transporter permease [Carnobacterium divergens]SBO17129.1 putative ABC-type antimicrobial peptide transport system [Carnobacterium divergens]
MKYLLKKLLRDIKDNIAQFITIILIVSIGAFLFIGLSSVSDSLKAYTNDYYKDYDLSDATINFVNIDQDQIDEIAAENSAITSIEGRTYLEGKEIFEKYSSKLSIFAISSNPKLNKSYVVKGKSALKANEILIDSDYAKAHNYAIGEKISLVINEKELEFTISGIIENPEFTMKLSGSDLTPQPKKYGIGYISKGMLSEIADDLNYNQVIFKAEGDVKKVIDSISEDYKDNYISGMLTEDSTAYSNLEGLINTDESLSKVIPVLFFAVAAVITFISVTRLIQQNRTQTGVMKSLGRTSGFIRIYYLMYTFLTSLVGTLIGSIGAYFAFINIGKMQVSSMYSLPNYEVIIEMKSVVPSFLIVFVFGLLAIYFSTSKVLKEKPASLIRQLPPKNVKGIILERITWFWKNISYGNKYVIRNLFLNKKRFLLNLFGVFLSFLMIVLAFGYYNAMDTVVNMEITDVNNYDLNITSGKIKEIQSEIETDFPKAVIEKMAVQSVEIGSGKDVVATTLYASDQKANLLRVYNKQGKNISDFSEGIIIPEVFAEKLNKKVGDKVEITYLNQDAYTIEASIKAISTQYSTNFIITSSKYLDRLDAPDIPSTLLIKNSKKADRDKMISSAKKIDENAIYTSKADIKKNMDAVLSTTLPMVIIFLLCSVSLTIATIYNVSSINIFDRNRDIATLKVLGYSRKKINKLIFRENVIISISAIVTAVPFTGILFRSFMDALTSELQSMPTQLPNWILIIAAFIVLGVTLLSNLFLQRKVKKIDMIGVLKSVE